MDFSALGEIIVALYRARSNGGSDFIGQVSLGVQDFLRIGTTVRGRQDCECRALRGSYILVDRRGSLLGGGADVDMNLRLEWRKRKPVAPMPPPKGSAPQQRGGGATTSNGSVSGNTRRSTSTTRPRSAAGGSVATGGRSTSTGRNGASQNPHTYRRERQQTLVAKENEAMRQRLEKIGPKTVQGADRAGIIREAYRSVPATSSAAATTANDQKRRADSKPSRSSNTASSKDQESKAPSHSSSLNLSKKSYAELLPIFDDLRTRVARASKDLQNQKLLTNKLRNQVEKHESLVERMKKVELQSRKGSGKGTPRPERKSTAVEEMESRYSVEGILTRNGLPANEEEITDQVLRELVVEHSALQQSRLSLVERVRVSNEKTEVIAKESNQLKQELDEVSSILRQSVQKIPHANWNLHQPHRASRLQTARAELESAKDAKKLVSLCGEMVFVAPLTLPPPPSLSLLCRHSS
jgi:hypothetical protein